MDRLEPKHWSNGSTHLPPKCKQASMVKKRTGSQDWGILLLLCYDGVAKLPHNLPARQFMQP